MNHYVDKIVHSVRYISKNGGRGFEPVQRLVPPGFDQTYTHWVSGIEFAGSSIGYAVAKGGGTWRTADGGEHWSFEPSSQTVWGIGIGNIADPLGASAPEDQTKMVGEEKHFNPFVGLL